MAECCGPFMFDRAEVRHDQARAVRLVRQEALAGVEALSRLSDALARSCRWRPSR